jgi:carboxypeptidase A5
MPCSPRPRPAATALAAAAALALLVTITGARAQQPPAHTANAPQPARFDGYQVVRVVNRSPDDLLRMMRAGAEVWDCHGVGIGPSRYLVSPDAQARLKAAGVQAQVLIRDVQALIDRERDQVAQARELRGPGYFSTYRTYAEISAFIDSLVATYPAMASRVSAGPSLQGRDIFGIRITGPGGPPAGAKPQVLLNSLQHAREWITGATSMWIANQLLASYATDSRVRRLADQYEWIIIPVVNPDGYVYTWSTNRLWRKNRRDNGNGTTGVDTNRNWGYQWGGEGASALGSDETYRGAGPFSEPETQAMRDFILANPRIVIAVDIHSYSQLILSPWSYTAAPCPDASIFDILNAGFEAAVESVHGMNYTAGPTYTTIYPASGAAGDWTYGAAGALGWGMELRDTGQNGFTLPADQIVPTSEETWAGLAWVADWLLDNPPLLITFPRGVPASVAAAAQNTIVFSVQRAFLRPAPGTAALFWRVGRSGPFQQAAVSSQADGSLAAAVTAGPCNSVLQFYVEAQSTTGQVVRFPSAGPAAPLEAVALQSPVVFADGFETAGAWTVGSPQDNATSGQWVRGTPIGTAAQPAAAHSGAACSFTGQGSPGGALGEADVDNGQTTLTSPLINLAGAPDAAFSYWRWYSNNAGAAPGADTFVVDVSADGGASWTRAETVGPAGPGTTGGWIQASWRLSALSPPVTPTSQMKVRFIASDLGAGSIIEAAVDDFEVRSFGCPLPPCPGDWNRDGAVVPADVAEFISAWVADLQNGTLVTDVNGDLAVTPADVALFVNAWNASLSGACGG